MTNIISAGIDAVNRPRLCRSNNQPNLLEYIDTTLTESFSLNLTLMRTISNGHDQFGNTILDQYLLYLLCQKINPNRSNDLINDLYRLLHRLIVLNGKISKSFFEYSTSSNNLLNYQNVFNSYTNFIWNEFDVNVLLELGQLPEYITNGPRAPSDRQPHTLTLPPPPCTLGIKLNGSSLSRSRCRTNVRFFLLGCFLLKYHLRDIFDTNNTLVQEKINGYFLEIIGLYYLSTNHHDYFINSRSVDMIFPSPGLYSLLPQTCQPDEKQTFHKFLDALYDNGEINFDLHQIRSLLKSDAYRFLNKKLENKKVDFIKFLETNICCRQRSSCRKLKSLCRLSIKMHIKQYPADIKQLSTLPLINDQLETYLIYENKLCFKS
ncbi:unnamed protein product [Rotaria magnacalcarata]|uniref:SOCS box domain-containing protein n=3 Tax=Rotaria magnacalcarata TaxID=392030 RepID=A0A818ZKL6_9BILA|nr:unnamed protein product [Rotaria magnacalcarata]CAF3813754.1 unnamed protein product [Rotaria magnacalcarata]